MIKISHKDGMVTFSLACIIRVYTYKVTVDGKTGRVRGITAGCRTWKSFNEANKHYTEYRWSDDSLNYRSDTCVAYRPYRYAERLEALNILSRLESAVKGQRNEARRKARAAKQLLATSRKAPAKRVTKRKA